MATLFLLADGRVEGTTCEGVALYLDADGRRTSVAWRVAVVPFAAAARAPQRYALVVAPGVAVVLDGSTLDAGVAELRDGDHFLVGAFEAFFSTDAVPALVAGEDAPCPVCCESLGIDGRRLFRCGRCGQTACSRCWSLAPRGMCLTANCGQPAALERMLWQPAPEDFVAWEGEP